MTPKTTTGFEGECMDAEILFCNNRKHPTIQLTAIPTLIEWGNGEVKIKQKLVEAECYDKQLLDAFFKE